MNKSPDSLKDRLLDSLPSVNTYNEFLAVVWELHYPPAIVYQYASEDGKKSISETLDKLLSELKREEESIKDYNPKTWLGRHAISLSKKSIEKIKNQLRYGIWN